MRKILSILLITIVMFGCKNTEKASKSSNEKTSYESVATEKLGGSYTKLFNDSKTHVICHMMDKKSKQDPTSQLRLLVFEVKTNELLYQKTVIDGKVKWKTDKQVEVRSPRQNPELSDGYEVYDVEKRKRIKTRSDL